MAEPFLRKIDCLRLHVLDLEAALGFYRDRLGLKLVWRTEQAAGLALPDSQAEIVLQTERSGIEVDFLVPSAKAAARAFEEAGGTVIVPPFDVQVGRAAVVLDPWDNEYVLLDMSRGHLVTGPAGEILGNETPEIKVREAVLDDAAGIARVIVDTWRSTYRGVLEDAFLDSLSYEPAEQRWRASLSQAAQPDTLVYAAENAQGEIVGVAFAGPEQGEEGEYQAEIYVLYVLPAYQRQGIGRRLVSTCCWKLHRQGRMSLLIRVLAENPSRAFYERLGGQVVRQREREIGGKKYAEVAYGWSDLSACLFS